MDNLYEFIETLAKEKGFKNITEFCRVSEIPRATMSELKAGRTKRLSAETLAKIASNLNVSVDYLLNGFYRCEVSSFANGITVFQGSSQHELESKLNELVAGTYQIAFQAPGVIVTVEKNSNATADQIDAIVSAYAKTEKAPTVNGERSVSDDDIKFALFGGDGDITDEMYEEVEDFAEYIKKRGPKKK